MVQPPIATRALLCAVASALLSSGCASTVNVTARHAAVDRVIAAAAGQVRRCYRAPRVATVGKQISTRLRVRFLPDGTLADIPIVVAQGGVTPENQPYAGKMAEAAGMAVMSCAPIKLPADLYVDGWNQLDLTFSPTSRG